MCEAMRVKRRLPTESRLSIVYRGVKLNESAFARIQGLIDATPGQTRQDIARQTCRMFRWRRPNGAWAVRSARDVLVRLDREGVIRMPAPRRRQGRPPSDALATAAMLVGATRPLGATEDPAAERADILLVRPISDDEVLMWRGHMERFHYLGDAALVGESLRYAAYLDGELVALLSWGAAALRNGPRDRHVGWDAATKSAKLHLVVNNARFLILPWHHRPHLASRVLGANLRRLSRDWEAAYGHRVMLAETFVDKSRFRGTCYRASNWLCVGESQGWSRSGKTYRFNGQPKSVWLYPLVRDFKKHLCLGKSAEGDNLPMVIDVDRLPLDGQGGLFEILGGIPDPRKARGVRHKIQGLTATAICAALAGMRSITSMAEWAAELPKETLLRLGSKRGKPPSERTLRRFFAAVDVAELDRQTGQWVAQQRKLLPGTGLAMDGKTVRGSSDGEKAAIHLLSAIVHGSGEVVAQVSVGAKTNEITKVEPLFEELEIKGVVVTGDALLTQRKIATYLVDVKEADYVFTAKDNQPTLRQDIETLGLDALPPSAHQRG